MKDLPQPFVTTTMLPPYRAILAVDAESYTSTPGVTHQALSDLIPSLVADALRQSGIGPEWDAKTIFGPTGDGFAAGLPTEILPALIFPFLHLLQNRLATHNHALRRGEPQIRLRVSINVGPLPAPHDNAALNGNGPERNNTHRLLDSKAIKAMLSGSSPNVTFVAAIISQRVFDDVVAAGFTGLHPDNFTEVTARVEGKTFNETGWLIVPEPSGALIKAGFAPPPHTTASIASKGGVADPDAGFNVVKNYGQAANVVHGGMHQKQPRPR